MSLQTILLIGILAVPVLSYFIHTFSVKKIYGVVKFKKGRHYPKIYGRKFDWSQSLPLFRKSKWLEVPFFKTSRNDHPILSLFKFVFFDSSNYENKNGASNKVIGFSIPIGTRFPFSHHKNSVRVIERSIDGRKQFGIRYYINGKPENVFFDYDPSMNDDHSVKFRISVSSFPAITDWESTFKDKDITVVQVDLIRPDMNIETKTVIYDGIMKKFLGRYWFRKMLPYFGGDLPAHTEVKYLLEELDKI